MTRGEEGGNDPWSAPPFQEVARLDRLFPSELETSARPRGRNAPQFSGQLVTSWTQQDRSRTPQPRVGQSMTVDKVLF